MSVDPRGLASIQGLPNQWQQNIELFGLQLTDRIHDGLLSLGLAFGSFVAPELRIGSALGIAEQTVVRSAINSNRTVVPEMDLSTRVGRCMSTNELKAMQGTKMVQESVTGTTHVASPASANAFMRQAKPGST